MKRKQNYLTEGYYIDYITGFQWHVLNIQMKCVTTYILVNIKMYCQKNCNYTEVQNFLFENTSLVHRKRKITQT